jgi:hypothetical protein
LSRPAKGGWSGVDLNGLVDKREVVLVIGELLDEFSDAPVERRAVIARSATEETPRHPDQLGWLEEVGSHTTLRWRGESAANSSLKMPKFASEAAKKGMKSVSYGRIPYAS